MKTKQRIAVVLVLLMSLVISGCGPGQLFGPTLTPTPTPLTDEEFTEFAREVCNALETEITPLIGTIDFASGADAYRKAADALAALEITEQSAPQGTHLRSGLAELADSTDIVDKALTEALTKANFDTPVTVMFTIGGKVYAYSGMIFNMTWLEIEPDLILDWFATQELVREAAISLELEQCAIEW